jgi:predicted permease
VLLVGAGLLLRSFLRVLEVDLGFEPDRAAAIKVDLDDGGNASRRAALLQEVLGRVRALPGIEAAGMSDMLPLDRNRSWGFAAKGQQYERGKYPDALLQVVTPGYLDAMGMRLRAGRDLRWEDSPDGEKVVIVNEAAARRLWPGEDPVGRIAMVNAGEARVIGVVADVRETSVEGEAGPEIYLPMTQARPVGAELVVRTRLAPGALASTVMSTLKAINPAQPAAEFRPIRAIVDHAVSPRRFFVLLVSAFAALGLALASLGIYGVISYSVTRRRQEIGIRLALGATARRVQLDVMSRTLELALAGIVIGAIASLALGRGIAALLFDTVPTDPATLVTTVLLLSSVAVVAGYIPARRASRISPMVTLRSD